MKVRAIINGSGDSKDFEITLYRCASHGKQTLYRTDKDIYIMRTEPRVGFSDISWNVLSDVVARSWCNEYGFYNFYR